YGSERSEFTRFGIRRLWRVAAPHVPAFFPYESRRDLRGWVSSYWLCVVVQSVCKIVGRFRQALKVREEKDARACCVSRGNCRTT
ncbi:hypothetical protein TGVAND_438950, partial [Toxoplasma gondii VAND]